MSKLNEIHMALEKVAPIESVFGDRNTPLRVVFAPEATAEQRAAALEIIRAVDLSAPEIKKPTVEERIAALESEVQKLKQAAIKGV